MKKITLSFVFVFVMFAFSASAQNKVARYQGEVQFAYAVGVGTYGIDAFNIRMINGVRVNEYFSAGIGIGLNFYIEDGESARALPIFANFKGYLPSSGAVRPFLSLETGYTIGFSDLANLGGILVSPEIGLSIRTSEKTAINFSLGYINQALGKGGASVNSGSIGFKLATVF